MESPPSIVSQRLLTALRSCESGTSCVRRTTKVCRCPTSSASSLRNTSPPSSKPSPSTCRRYFITTARTAESAARGRQLQLRRKNSWRQNCSACNRTRLCNDQVATPTDWSDLICVSKTFWPKHRPNFCRLIGSNANEETWAFCVFLYRLVTSLVVSESQVIISWRGVFPELFFIFWIKVNDE